MELVKHDVVPPAASPDSPSDSAWGLSPRSDRSRPPAESGTRDRELAVRPIGRTNSARPRVNLSRSSRKSHFPRASWRRGPIALDHEIDMFFTRRPKTKAVPVFLEGRAMRPFQYVVPHLEKLRRLAASKRASAPPVPVGAAWGSPKQASAGDAARCLDRRRVPLPGARRARRCRALCHEASAVTLHLVKLCVGAEFARGPSRMDRGRGWSRRSAAATLSPPGTWAASAFFSLEGSPSFADRRFEASARLSWGAQKFVAHARLTALAELARGRFMQRRWRSRRH